jgi:hypothetical protein
VKNESVHITSLGQAALLFGIRREFFHRMFYKPFCTQSGFSLTYNRLVRKKDGNLNQRQKPLALEFK